MKSLRKRTLGFILLIGAISFSSCKSKDTPGHIYMPDMAYGRAYESYGERDSLKFTTDNSRKGGKMIYYNAMPVKGTIKREELLPYTLANDSNGYKMSAFVKNPTDSASMSMSEAGRLYNINCAICHGDKGTGNGPLAPKIGAVANLTLPNYVAMADGTMFHSITYGKNNMGSYASQLDRNQRWMIVRYIRGLQPKATATAAAAPAPKDSIPTKAK